MIGLRPLRRYNITLFFLIFNAWMSVYVTSPEAVWALRPRGKPPPCSLELHERLVSLDLWTPTRLIHTSVGWRPVPRRGCRAGRRVCKQRVTSVSVSTSPTRREWQIPVIVGRQLSAERQSAEITVGHHGTTPTRQSVLCKCSALSSSSTTSRLRDVRRLCSIVRSQRSRSVQTSRHKPAGC